MAGFDNAWLAVSGTRNGEPLSPELRPLLEAVYHHVLAEPLDQPTLKQNLVELLTFLGAEGRSNANCWAVGLFFAVSRGWERDWAELNLPENIHDVLHTGRQDQRTSGTIKSSEFYCFAMPAFEQS